MTSGARTPVARWSGRHPSSNGDPSGWSAGPWARSRARVWYVERRSAIDCKGGVPSARAASCSGAPEPVGTGADRTTTRSGAELRIGSSLHHLFDQKVVRQDDYLDFIPLGSAIGHRTGGSGDKVGPYSHPQGRSAPVLPLLRCAPLVGAPRVALPPAGTTGRWSLVQVCAAGAPPCAWSVRARGAITLPVSFLAERLL